MRKTLEYLLFLLTLSLAHPFTGNQTHFHHASGVISTRLTDRISPQKVQHRADTLSKSKTLFEKVK